jgi:hypothetical protein
VPSKDIITFNIKKTEQLRELEQAGVAVHEHVAAICYLENLSTEFETFVAVNMMKDELHLSAVMSGSVDFASSAAAC